MNPQGLSQPPSHAFFNLIQKKKKTPHQQTNNKKLSENVAKAAVSVLFVCVQDMCL